MHCSLGRLSMKALKDEGRGIAYHRKCLQLAQSLLPVPLHASWYQVNEHLLGLICWLLPSAHKVPMSLFNWAAYVKAISATAITATASCAA